MNEKDIKKFTKIIGEYNHIIDAKSGHSSWATTLKCPICNETGSPELLQIYSSLPCSSCQSKLDKINPALR